MKVWLLEAIITEIESKDYETETWVFKTKEKAKDFIKDAFLTPDCHYPEDIIEIKEYEKCDITWFDLYTKTSYEEKTYFYKKELILSEITVL